MAKTKHLSFKLSKVKTSGVAIAMAIIIIGVVGAIAALFFIALTEPVGAVRCTSLPPTLTLTSANTTTNNLPSGANKNLMVLDVAVANTASSGGSPYTTGHNLDVVSVVVVSNKSFSGVVVSALDQTNKSLGRGVFKKIGTNSYRAFVSLPLVKNSASSTIVKFFVDISKITFVKGDTFRANISAVYPGGGYLSKCLSPRVLGKPFGPTYIKK